MAHNRQKHYGIGFLITRYLPYQLLLVVIILTAVTGSPDALADTEEPLISQEYFIQQAADEDLFIRINGFEAEFSSRVSTQEGQQLMLSGIPATRLVPVFQYISAPDKDRQLDIEVFSNRYTGRSEFGLELVRLKAWDDRSSSVSRAYSLLSFGMLSSKSSSAANWTVKIDSLIEAGRLFQNFGMIEMRLWCNYLAAHLIHYYLHDDSIVYSMTRDILSELKTARFQKIELATLQLQSAALIGLKKASALSAPADKPDPVQTVLSRVNSLAKTMGYQLEQALALDASGNEYVSDAFYPEALEQFKQAVKIADTLADGELATGIRESIVKIYALEGDTQASNEELKKIESQLQEEGASDELALTLLARGRLLSSNYQYNQAIDVLQESLKHENDSAIRQQVRFELAKAFYQVGQLEESLAYLTQAGISPDSAQNSRGSSIIDFGEGLRMMSNIHRVRGNFSQMRLSRDAQGFFQSNPARQLYDEALDELAAAGKNLGTAQSRFKQSLRKSITSGSVDLQDLSRLQYCALVTGEDSLCNKADTRASYERLSEGGIPRHTTEAMFLWARILVRKGQLSEAIAVLDSLVNEIHLLRLALPGVLGAWYRERHEQIFEYYLELLSGDTSQRGRADALSSLLVLSKIRYIERQTGAWASERVANRDTDRLRAQLAQREVSGPGPTEANLNKQINHGMADLRASFDKEFEYLSRPGIQKHLRSLGNNEVVLTYHISPTTAQVWIGQKGGVQRRSITNPAYIYAALQEARGGLANLGLMSFESKMDALGKRLAEPVSDLLTDTIYWVPAGPLLGFPLDALRLKGRYLVEDHSIVNLLSFPGNPLPHQTIVLSAQSRVFLAGLPQNFTGEYATRLQTSPEIQSVTDIFVGQGLTIVQGAALLPEEFRSEKLAQAQLVHLSMPGVIDLKYPGQSSLELSGYQDGSGRASLKPFDIQSLTLMADLVFLSATRVTEQPDSAFISQPAFVSDFIGVGAQSVIARFWVSGGGISELFIKDFYRQLETTGNVAIALTNAKRAYLRTNRENGLYDWAGYQLFTN